MCSSLGRKLQKFDGIWTSPRKYGKYLTDAREERQEVSSRATTDGISLDQYNQRPDRTAEFEELRLEMVSGDG